MKRFVMVAAMCCLFSSPARAALKVSGNDSTMQIDTSGFPTEMKANYELMTSKCTKCHTLERLVISYTSWVAAVSDQPFDMEFLKVTAYSMFRKSEAKNFPISKDERKSIYAVLKFMLDGSAH